jgi:hypothetical protein
MPRCVLLPVEKSNHTPVPGIAAGALVRSCTTIVMQRRHTPTRQHTIPEVQVICQRAHPKTHWNPRSNISQSTPIKRLPNLSAPQGGVTATVVCDTQTATQGISGPPPVNTNPPAQAAVLHHLRSTATRAGLQQAVQPSHLPYQHRWLPKGCPGMS